MTPLHRFKICSVLLDEDLCWIVDGIPMFAINAIRLSWKIESGSHALVRWTISLGLPRIIELSRGDPANKIFQSLVSPRSVKANRCTYHHVC